MNNSERSPIVSIIMSTYNDSIYIKESIRSVLQQTFTNWEFIIIDDASTDDTETIILTYCKNDKRFKYHANKNNEGQTVNLNKSLSLAKGEFIARIDGDDIWSNKNKLKEQVDFLNNYPEVGLVGTFWININVKGEKISNSIYPTDDEEIRNYLLIENCFLHSSAVIRKSIIDEVGYYDIRYQYAQDYDLWLRVGKISKLYNIPKFMVHYRINPHGLTLTKYKKQLQESTTIVKKNKNYYPNYKKAMLFWHLRKYIPKNNYKLLLLKSLIRKYILRES